MKSNLSIYEIAGQQLSSNDQVLAGLIKKYGPYQPRPHADYYRELAGSIIGQQLSVKAAATIEKRFIALFTGDYPTAEQILAAEVELLRSAGLSRAKANYVIDLARHIESGELQVDKLPSLSNDEVIAELVAVKGIGQWTAHMFLMFALGRLDILPVGDFGLRAGLKKLYGLADLPAPLQIQQVAEANGWAPYQSVATWYIWRSLDNAPVR